MRLCRSSNEAAWAAGEWLPGHRAEAEGLPHVVSVQNEYSLLCRPFDTDMAEVSVMEDVPLLAYSPLATGLLTGKYAGDVTPEGSRRSITADLSGRVTPRVFAAVSAYLGLAREWSLDPARHGAGLVAGAAQPEGPVSAPFRSWRVDHLDCPGVGAS